MSKPYRVCPKCGCNLDHGERCDCEDRVELDQAQSVADTAAQPATGDDREPAVDCGAIPSHQSDAMCRTLIGCVGRLFENPAVMADYKRWQQERQQKGGNRAKN